MRPSVLLLFLIAAAVLGETAVTSAQPASSYPWCGRTGRDLGATSCYFTSYRQCMTTISGIGGFCYESPYYHASLASGTVRPHRN